MNYNNIDYIQKNAPATQDEIESVEKRIVLPYEIVTEDNVDDYMARNF